MAKHHPDLIFCRKQAGVGKNGSSFLKTTLFLLVTMPRIVDLDGSRHPWSCRATIPQVNAPSTGDPLVQRSRSPAPGGTKGLTAGVSPSMNLIASLCSLPQRDGCPKIVNLGSSKTDLFYERKKYGFKKR
nr:PREDICTED: PHD finger-like domain-containing protein 5A [Lepisosteus oculatus]